MAALQGKVAVITGGSSGIGLAAAKRFVAEGASVFITGRQQAELDEAVKEIGRNVVAVRSDVSNLGNLDQLYKEVAAKKGKIDILFANAGIVETVETSAVTPEHFDRTFNINARGVYFTVQKALPFLNDGASIILSGSVVGQKGMPIYSTYAATKAALRSYVRTWAAEFGGRGIRANVISAGPIETPILDRQFPTKEAADALREPFKAQSRSAGSAFRRRLPPPPYSLRRRRAVKSVASTWRLTEAWSRCDTGTHELKEASCGAMSCAVTIDLDVSKIFGGYNVRSTAGRFADPWQR